MVKNNKDIKNEVARYQGLARKPRLRSAVFADKTKYNRNREKQQYRRYEMG